MSNKEASSRSPNRINAVENVFDIIEHVQELGGCGVVELATEMDIPKSTAHVYLKTLEDEGYVTKRDDTYRLSLRFLEVGGEVRHQSKLYQVGRSVVDDLAEETGEVGTLGTEENGYRVMLYRTQPSGAVFNNAPTGEYTNMHWTSVGKALLSLKTDERIRSIVDRHGLPRATDHTITDVESLLDTVDAIRSRGYAIEDEERVAGVKAVAVPIETVDSPDTAVSLSGPKHEFDAEQIENELLPPLRNSANVIELTAKHY